MKGDTNTTIAPITTAIATETTSATVIDHGGQDTDSGKFKFKRSAVEIVPAEMPSEETRDLFGDDAVIKWTDEGRKKSLAKVGLTVIEANTHYDHVKCDNDQQTTDAGGDVYEDSFENDLNASIVKYAPYTTCEENSSRGIKYVGSYG